MYFMNTIKNSKPLEERLLSGPHVAREIDMDPATIRRWRKEGAPHHLIGNGVIRYRLSELLAWRRSRLVKSN
jgi:hypothetical protein